MSIIIKTPEQIEGIRTACRLTADVLEMITPHVIAGVTTQQLDEQMNHFIIHQLGAVSACLGYGHPPYSKCTCISINHVVCHGVPSDKKLKEGDIVNIDVSIIKDGYFGDCSRMFMVGQTSILAQKLVRVTQECLHIGIEQTRPGVRLNEIGKAIAQHAHANQFSVVEDYCGHGVGIQFHEAPQVLHYAGRDDGVILKPGMIFTIEPMINAGKHRTKVLPDQWTVITQDRSLSAQWEHTILITEVGHEILTLPSSCS